MSVKQDIVKRFLNKCEEYRDMKVFTEHEEYIALFGLCIMSGVIGSVEIELYDKYHELIDVKMIHERMDKILADKAARVEAAKEVANDNGDEVRP